MFILAISLCSSTCNAQVFRITIINADGEINPIAHGASMDFMDVIGIIEELFDDMNNTDEDEGEDKQPKAVVVYDDRGRKFTFAGDALVSSSLHPNEDMSTESTLKKVLSGYEKSSKLMQSHIQASFFDKYERREEELPRAATMWKNEL